MWKRFTTFGCIVLVVLVIGVEMKMDAVTSTGQSEQYTGKMYLNQLEFPEEAVLFDTPNGALYSLRTFFEGIGSQVIYEKETGNIQINHLNQVLLWEKSEDSNTFTLVKTVNPNNMEYGSSVNDLLLNPMAGIGWYTIIDGRTYLAEETFTWMLKCLGYGIEIDRTKKTATVFPRTINGSKLGSGGFPNRINGENYFLGPLSDGCWIGSHWDSEKSAEIIVDAEGRIYQLTDKVVPGSYADNSQNE